MISLLFTGFFLLPLTASAQGVMRIAAVVNDDVISALDLAQRVRLTIVTSRMQDSPQVRKRLASNILKLMIDERLKAQEAKKLGFGASDDEIKNGLVGYAQSQKIKPEMLVPFLNKIGVDIEVLEDQAIAEITWTKMLTRRGGERTRVSEKEVDDAFAQIQANKGKPEYLYSEIFIPVEAPSQDGAARQMSERLIGHIQNGSPFAALARDFSQSPSAANGGKLGWVQSGSISANIEAALQAIEEGGYSPVLRTQSGYYILQLHKMRISGQEEDDEILDVAQAVLPFAPNMAEDLRNAKRAAARNLAYEAQSCDNLVELAKKIEGGLGSRFANVKLSSMPGDIRTVLKPLRANQITTHEQKNKAVLVLMVCERKPVPKTPDIAKKKRLKQHLRMEKIGRENRRILQRLRRNAFVDIRL
nr:peptidylprolyl isomerase [Candidatus Terasakiella magnetica]